LDQSVILSEDEKELLKNKTHYKDNLLIAKDNLEFQMIKNNDDNARNFLILNDSDNENAGFEINKNLTKNDSNEKYLILKNKLCRGHLSSKNEKNRINNLNSFMEKFISLSNKLLIKDFNNENKNITDAKIGFSNDEIKNDFILLENEEHNICEIHYNSFKQFAEQQKQIIKNYSRISFFDTTNQ
jgi:hypothetical protein